MCSLLDKGAIVYFSETKNTDKKTIRPALQCVKDSRSVCLGRSEVSSVTLDGLDRRISG